MRVTLFTKQNCQLCDAIKYEILDLQVEYGFDFDETYLEEGPEGSAEESRLVPVVTIERNGKATVRLDHPVEQTELRRLIRSEKKVL